jgi:hypothetical protein
MFFKVAVVSLLGYLALVPSPPTSPSQPPTLPTLAPPTPSAPVTAGAAPQPLPPPPAPMVVVVPSAASSTRVVDVRRADLEQAMLAPRPGRMVPALTDGKPSGVKIYAIRPGSALAAIGLENGDTLRAINDVPMTSADAALEIYRPHKEPDHFDLDIVRKGERVRIVVLVH